MGGVPRVVGALALAAVVALAVQSWSATSSIAVDHSVDTSNARGMRPTRQQQLQEQKQKPRRGGGEVTQNYITDIPFENVFEERCAAWGCTCQVSISALVYHSHCQCRDMFHCFSQRCFLCEWWLSKLIHSHQRIPANGVHERDCSSRACVCSCISGDGVITPLRAK